MSNAINKGNILSDFICRSWIPKCLSLFADLSLSPLYLFSIYTLVYSFECDLIGSVGWEATKSVTPTHSLLGLVTSSSVSSLKCTSAWLLWILLARVLQRRCAQLVCLPIGPIHQ